MLDKSTNYHFFLGGNDLEMAEIKAFLQLHRLPFTDANLGWGAKASAYEAEIRLVAAQGKIPVLIELVVDIDLPEGVVVIDHHGERSGEPASILQVLSLVGEKPTRRQKLIAADDSGGYFGLLEFGATPEEIHAILKEGRAAQGFTPEMEAESVTAVKAAEHVEEVDLVIVRLPFSKFAAAKAILWLQGRKNMIFVASDGEVEFQGDGSVCQLLKDHFSENSWCGGAGLGQPGRFDAFWGGYHPSQEVIQFVKSHLA